MPSGNVGKKNKKLFYSLQALGPALDRKGQVCGPSKDLGNEGPPRALPVYIQDKAWTIPSLAWSRHLIALPLIY